MLGIGDGRSRKSRLSQVFSRDLKVAISGFLPVFFILLLGKILWGWPARLFLFFAIGFTIVALIYWLFIRKRAASFVALITSIGVWIVLSCSLLGIVFKLDRAGWNWFRLTGYDTTIPEQRQEEMSQTTDDFLKRHPIFKYDSDKPKMVRLASGEHEITETIVVPQHMDLLIEPGAILKFGAGCSLISYGAVIAVGTEQSPIRFAARHNWTKWGVVGIMKASRSRFEYAYFENARWATVNDFQFVAGLTVIETDVEIKNCRFEEMFGKDAVNVRHARAIVANNTFKNVYKDGIDMDGGTGEIVDNLFINCQDEAIDLSENLDIQVYGNTVKDAYGGRIAAENEVEQVRAGNTLGYL